LPTDSPWRTRKIRISDPMLSDLQWLDHERREGGGQPVLFR